MTIWKIVIMASTVRRKGLKVLSLFISRLAKQVQLCPNAETKNGRTQVFLFMRDKQKNMVTI